jgi:hypothetical protein
MGSLCERAHPNGSPPGQNGFVLYTSPFESCHHKALRKEEKCLRIQNAFAQVLWYQYAMGFNDATGEWIPSAPPAGSMLRLFGMGFRNRRSLDDVKVTVEGRQLRVLYAGPSPLDGKLDELDVESPAELSGTGTQLLWLSVEGIRANPVRVEFGSGQ